MHYISPPKVVGYHHGQYKTFPKYKLKETLSDENIDNFLSKYDQFEQENTSDWISLKVYPLINALIYMGYENRFKRVMERIFQKKNSNISVSLFNYYLKYPEKMLPVVEEFKDCFYDFRRDAIAKKYLINNDLIKIGERGDLFWLSLLEKYYSKDSDLNMFYCQKKRDCFLDFAHLLNRSAKKGNVNFFKKAMKTQFSKWFDTYTKLCILRSGSINLIKYALETELIEPDFKHKNSVGQVFSVADFLMMYKKKNVLKEINWLIEEHGVVPIKYTMSDVFGLFNVEG